MAVLLKDDAGEIAAADDQNFLVVLFQFFDQRNEITVSADDNERVDVISRECHLQGVERKIDVCAVFVAARA